MTREEAIKDIQENIKPFVGGKSLDMAIKALSQPIVCKDYCIDDDNIYCSPKVAERVVEAPSADRWIPCSERLPEPNRHDALNVDVYYLAQTEFGDMIVASYNESHEGTKWWEQMYSYRIFDDEIVAWMPLPEPWKGGEEE